MLCFIISETETETQTATETAVSAQAPAHSARDTQPRQRCQKVLQTNSASCASRSEPGEFALVAACLSAQAASGSQIAIARSAATRHSQTCEQTRTAKTKVAASSSSARTSSTAELGAEGAS